MVVTVIGVHWASYSSAQEAIWDECRATNSCTIEFDHLSKQESEPFLFLGKVMDADHPRWHQYRRTLGSYTNVRDCLVLDEQNKAKPNLLMLDWHRVGAGSGAEICIFRIARSLNDIDRIKKWLEYHAFLVGEKRLRYVGNYLPSLKTMPVANLTAWWTREQYREVSPSWASSLFGIDLILSYQVVIGFSRENKVTAVGVVTPSK